MPSNPAVQDLIGSLRQYVDELALNHAVLAALLPQGRPHDFETQLWDYKVQLPSLPASPSDADRKLHRAELGDIIKDAVSLHNAYGGYILFGVADSGKNRVVGCAGHFDCGDFNKRLESYTGTSIECLYARIPVSASSPSAEVGLLLVPRRRTGARPVSFIKKGPEKPNGSRAFLEETYVRIRDECRPAAATSEDWEFLHSDRAPEPRAVSNHPPVQLLLPSRDPDLVKFVGRKKPLADLREWLSDERSPSRLVTGIGGLGKTTLAYHFAEEIGRVGAGEIEWVIWVTAKQRTFSALRGKMVSASKVDFYDLLSLYGAILKALSHELPVDEDEPTLDQLSDRVVDALQNYTCLIVVDDIDSLAPEEQKEVVAALNALALRTVGRELPPSRVLLTSRIDQGMPPTAVIKISGLEFEDFEQYVANLCETFGIDPIRAPRLQELWTATSGSPLFAASVVRLVRLGESLKTAIETWRGQEGEDVRKFAFEREVKRLDLMQSKLLYAVLLLGETTVADLAAVLEVTPKIVRDKVSELQAYHLISTAIKTSGDAAIVPPSDLVAVTEILRGHLGAAAAGVETSCARAQASTNVDSRTVGVSIRRMLASWHAERPDEALVIAQDLVRKFPKSGDAANVLGQAYSRLRPPNHREAEKAFELARKLGCSRPELVNELIKTKIALEDWQGLYELTSKLRSNAAGRDGPLIAFVQASWGLISAARSRGDDARIAELAIAGVERLSQKFARTRIDKAHYAELNEQRLQFAREYIHALDRRNPLPGDKLRVFEGVVRLAEAEVVLADLLSGGLKALQAWWGDVERRPVVDLTACSILQRQLKRLEQIENDLAHRANRAPLADKIAHVRMELAHRGAKLAS